MKADWTVGDFSTSIEAKYDPDSAWSRSNRDILVKALGVLFLRADIDEMLPKAVEPDIEDSKPPVADSDLKSFFVLFVELNTKGGKSQPGLEAVVTAAKTFFPRNSVTRVRISELRGPQAMGRPPKVAK